MTSLASKRAREDQNFDHEEKRKRVFSVGIDMVTEWMCDSASVGNIAGLRYGLEMGVSVLEKNTFGETVLEKALASSNKECRDEVLLQAAGSEPALMEYAVRTKDWDLCKEVLRRMNWEAMREAVMDIARLQDDQWGFLETLVTRMNKKGPTDFHLTPQRHRSRQNEPVLSRAEVAPKVQKSVLALPKSHKVARNLSQSFSALGANEHENPKSQLALENHDAEKNQTTSRQAKSSGEEYTVSGSGNGDAGDIMNKSFWNVSKGGKRSSNKESASLKSLDPEQSLDQFPPTQYSEENSGRTVSEGEVSEGGNAQQALPPNNVNEKKQKEQRGEESVGSESQRTHDDKGINNSHKLVVEQSSADFRNWQTPGDEMDQEIDRLPRQEELSPVEDDEVSSLSSLEFLAKGKNKSNESESRHGESEASSMLRAKTFKRAANLERYKQSLLRDDFALCIPVPQHPEDHNLVNEFLENHKSRRSQQLSMFGVDVPVWKLAAQHWLCDQVIDSFFDMVRMSCFKDCKVQSEEIVVVKSQFSQKVLGLPSEYFNERKNLSKLCRNFFKFSDGRPVKIRNELNSFLMPICVNGHWVLCRCLVSRTLRGTVDSCAIQVYNSLESQRAKIESTVKEIIRKFFLRVWPERDSFTKLRVVSCRYRMCEDILQSNSDDCGVFVCVVGGLLAQGWTWENIVRELSVTSDSSSQSQTGRRRHHITHFEDFRRSILANFLRFEHKFNSGSTL